MNVKCTDTTNIIAYVNGSRNDLQGDLYYNRLTIVSELFTQFGAINFHSTAHFSSVLIMHQNTYNLSRLRH